MTTEVTVSSEDSKMERHLAIVVCLCLVFEAVVGSDPFLIDAPYSSRISDVAGKGRSPPPPPPRGHSPRVRRQTTECGSTTVGAMTSEQKTEVVDAHNHCRSKEQSRNELKMEWDEDLAKLAQAWANQCIWEHNLLTDCNGESVGQNLFMTRSDSGFPPVNVTFATESWYNERQYYNFPNQTCQEGQKCGHFTQVVAAKTLKMGCGFKLCDTIQAAGGTWTNALLMVCDYNPPGNIKGAEIFMAGQPCTACTSVTGSLKYRGYRCEENLCVPCTPEQNPECQCGESLTCKNGGTYSGSTCVCKCPSGFYGPTCEQTCSCVDVYASSTCTGWKDFCVDPTYQDFMQSYCAQTCNMCVTDPSCPQ